MIKFDNNGNPQPPVFLALELEEIKTVYVDSFINSNTRAPIFNNYQKYLREFKNIVRISFNQWINGSYTTTKENPNDIDLVNLITYSDDLNSKQDQIIPFLTIGGSKRLYDVDGYFVPIYPETDPRYEVTKKNMEYWKSWFGHDRQNRPKAIIELEIQ